MPTLRQRTLLLTGATGFVGRYLYPALQASGHRVRCGSRDPLTARSRMPGREWVRLELSEPDTVCSALEGCDSAVYLVHAVGRGGDYPERERRAAETFRAAAEDTGVERIVYLGGVAPKGKASRHLESRLNTGRILRAGSVTVVELRAAMVIGLGSASWQMVRDLAVRLPVMILPRWLDHRSCPLAIDDAVAAILIALDPRTNGGWYDAPGPECLSHRQMLERVARLMGSHIPMLRLPVLTPTLSSYWITLVTRTDIGIARELVQGLQADLIPHGPSIWEQLPRCARVPLDQAIHDAFEDETSAEVPSARAARAIAEVGRAITAALADLGST
ncbi:MAG: NAD(P)H-binding protein [Polyangiaceae bacterium]|nr:NAD(P)H-binding protein [Polyangiaceae bacterium]